MPGSSRRHSATPEYTCRDSSDRRHSTSSDTSLPDSTHFRQLSQENIEYIPTRMKQVTASKPAANPLKFVKVGPCDLYRSAQEQLKKVEEVKKMKQEVKEEAEDWQSNLDNWKSSRRKRQEHIIERVVEVKKFELEEYDRNRRRSKTFNEMMEERNSRGRKMSLVMYKEEDSNDLSDLGIRTSSGKSSVCGDYGNDDNQSVSDREEIEKHPCETHNGKNGMNGHHEDASALAIVSSPEPEEYTYERAIQSYVNFTETRVKSKPVGRKSLSSSREELDYAGDKVPNGHSNKSPPVKPRRESNPQIGSRLSALEHRRRSSTDLNSITDSSRILPLPKVDVLKRRELFEKASENNEPISKISNKKSSNLSNTISIKERLSHLEKQTDTANNTSKGNSRIANEISSSVKERLTSLQKQRSTDNLIEKDTVKTNRLSSGDITSTQSIRSRLSHHEKQNSAGDGKSNQHSIKERLSSLDAACTKDSAKRVTPDRDPSFHNKLANFQNIPEDESDKNNKTAVAESERSISPEDEEIYPTKRQQFHRSLDSLDVESSNDVVNEAFERVQSLEDLDCCNRARNYPASASSTEMLAFSSQSGDTDREDSGIHTADVSCSVSQADEPVEDGEIITTISSVVPHFELNKNGQDSYHLEVEIVNHKRQGSGMSDIPQEEARAYLHVENSVDTQQLPPDVPSSSCDELTTMTQVEEMTKSQASDDQVWHDAVADMSDNSLKDETPRHLLSQLIQEEVEKPLVDKEVTQVFFPVSTSQIPSLSLSRDIEIVSGLAFPLGPPSSAEPPKEKPPPPPMELSDEDTPLPESPLRRLDSTKRIKKEIRRKRSDFLGIEGKTDDDSYLEPELQVAPPPDMTSFLVEERRLEQQLYRQSICSESDSNLGETTESRDSGVELDRGQSDDAWSSKQPLTPDALSAPHSRQNSELYGNTSITSEEDEITKKEREIIEILEKEEQWRYGNSTSNQQDNIGEKLAVKLRELEQEKLRLEWERTEEANRRQEDELRLRAKEEELRQQESVERQPSGAGEEDISTSGESLRSERERLQQEQEELLRQKESLQAQVEHQRWNSHSAHLSLQDVSNVQGYPSPSTLAPPRPAEPLNYRLSLPDLQQDPQGVIAVMAGQSLSSSPARRAPPPIPPAKPLRTVTQEQRERDNSIRGSRMPSADSLPQQMEPTHVQHSSVPVQMGGQQMSRQTLQALSAAPRSRLITNDTWIQAKKKPEGHRTTLNNQHWLIQEAEHRRITEQQQRNATSPRKTLPPQYWAQQQPQPIQRQEKPLPDAIIQTLTQRVQNRTGLVDNKKASNRIRVEASPSRDAASSVQHYPMQNTNPPLTNGDSQEKMLSVSGKKKCSHCGDELGRGAAMIIESLRLFYHIDCFKCCVCHVQLGDGLMGTDVRVRNNKLHCHNCYSSEDGVKFSCV